MANLPAYLTDQTEEAIRKRLLDAMPVSYDKSEGSFLWDLMAAFAIELAMGADWAQQVLERGFAQTTFGPYLDLRAEEHGLTRRPAVQAVGTVTFTGAPGATIPAGTRVSTGSSASSPAVFFTTDKEATIPAGQTTVDVPVTAEEAGASGNVGANTIVFLASPIAGITAVTNGSPTSGGADAESDADLLARYLARVRNPSAGGNKADYINWALEVSGVGGVAVVPVRDGPGTVSVAIIDTNKQPAGQALVDAVQDYIAPPWVNSQEAENMTLGGFGASVDGTAVKLVYDSGGEATITDPDLQNVLQQPGIWQARVSTKVDATTETVDLLEIGVWNISAAAWAKTSPSSGTDARVVLTASDLSTAYADVIQQFYWNGQDQIELRIARLQSDTTTQVWVDTVVYRSTFSRDTGEGKAPIGARVTVEPAQAVLISVSATLTIATGYDAAAVRAAVEQNIDAYLKGLALTSDNDVLYVRIGEAILDTPGVKDYSDLLVNGGTANVPIGDQQVAVKGTITLN